MTATPDNDNKQQMLDVAEIAATLSRRYTPQGVTNWLTESTIEDRQMESPLELIQTGQIAIVKQAAERAVT